MENSEDEFSMVPNNCHELLSVICLKVGNHDFDNLTSTPQGLDMQRMRLSLSVSRVYLVIFKSVSS